MIIWIDIGVLIMNDISIIIPGTSNKALIVLFVPPQKGRQLNFWLLIHLRNSLFLDPLRPIYLGLLGGHYMIPLGLPHGCLLLSLLPECFGPLHLLRPFLSPV